MKFPTSRLHLNLIISQKDPHFQIPSHGGGGGVSGQKFYFILGAKDLLTEETTITDNEQVQYLIEDYLT